MAGNVRAVLRSPLYPGIKGLSFSYFLGKWHPVWAVSLGHLWGGIKWPRLSPCSLTVLTGQGATPVLHWATSPYLLMSCGKSGHVSHMNSVQHSQTGAQYLAPTDKSLKIPTDQRTDVRTNPDTPLSGFIRLPFFHSVHPPLPHSIHTSSGLLAFQRNFSLRVPLSASSAFLLHLEGTIKAGSAAAADPNPFCVLSPGVQGTTLCDWGLPEGRPQC